MRPLEVGQRFELGLTSVADLADGRSGEEQDPLLEEGQSPQDKHLGAKELQEVTEAAHRVLNQLKTMEKTWQSLRLS